MVVLGACSAPARRSGCFSQTELVVLGAEPPVQSLGVVVEHGLPEVWLVENALEDVSFSSMRRTTVSRNVRSKTAARAR